MAKRWLGGAMMLVLGWADAGAVGAPPQRTDPRPPAASAVQTAVDEAAVMNHAGNAAGALARLEPVMAQIDKAMTGPPGTVYCAQTLPEALVYAGMAAQDHKSAVILPGADCLALFHKAYALGELKQPAAATALLRQLVAVAPQDAQFLMELGAEVSTHGGDREEALALYRRALTAVAIAPPAVAATLHGAALRGIGFQLTEQGDLAGAEKAYRESLVYDSASPTARHELDYIAGLRAKTNKPTAAEMIPAGKPLPSGN